MPTTHTASQATRPSLTEFERVFDALAHEARRHIVLLLAHHGPELPSGYLASRLSHSWPTTTRHLHVLEAAGIVTVRREGATASTGSSATTSSESWAGGSRSSNHRVETSSGALRVPARSE